LQPYTEGSVIRAAATTEQDPVLDDAQGLEGSKRLFDLSIEGHDR
jgi:hypothetical protein